MDLGLTGKVALVTGGSRGIGRAIVLALAREGCHVAVAARTESALKEVAEDARALGVDVLPVVADLSEISSGQSLVDQTVAWKDRLDVLVACAPVVVPPDARYPEEELQRIHGKVLSTMRCARAAAAVMRERGGGSIVCLGGTSASYVPGMLDRYPIMPGGGSTLSQGLGNAAIANFAKHFSDVVAPDGIIVNTVQPGLVRTRRHAERVQRLADELQLSPEQAEDLYRARSPMGRLPEPEEVAAVAVFLASRQASGVTGQAISVDAGMNRTIGY